MNIALKPVQSPELIDRLVNQLHGIVRIVENPGAQKQPFNIVSPVELDRQLADFVRCEGRSRHVIGTPVDAVFTVIDTFIGEQDLEKRNASPVSSKAVADSPGNRVSDSCSVPLSPYAAGRAGDIILGSVRQNPQLLHQRLLTGRVYRCQIGKLLRRFHRSGCQMALITFHGSLLFSERCRPLSPLPEISHPQRFEKPRSLQAFVLPTPHSPPG